MRRQTAVVLCIALAALLVGGAAQAQTPVVRVVLGSSTIQGEDWGDTKEIKATLRNAAGGVKGVCWVNTFTTGEFYCNWGQGLLSAAGVLPPATTEPGDTLSVEHEGSTYASGPLAELRLGNLDPVTDTVVGRVVPRRAKVRVRVFPLSRLTPTGPGHVVPFAKVGTTAADGAFAVDLTSEGNPVRNDRVFVGAVQGRFEVGIWANFPGLEFQKDTNLGSLSGIPSTVRQVRLYGPGGVLKSETTVTLGGGSLVSTAVATPQGAAVARNGFGSAGIFIFKDAAGRPVRILEGDIIAAVGGPSAFSVRVPKLTLAINASRFAVQTLPNRPLYLSGAVFLGPGQGSTQHSAFGKSDGTGSFFIDPPETITPYSTAFVEINLDGNRVTASRTLAP